MNEPAPIGINPLNSVDQDQQDTEQSITNSLNQAGHKVTAEGISANPKFPSDLVEGIGGEIVDKVQDTTEYIRATTEGSNYARTTDSKRPISIARFRERLRLKKVA